MTAEQTCCDSSMYERDGKLWCLNAYCLHSYWRQNEIDANEIPEYVWETRTGRDGEGTLFTSHNLVAATGRVFAKVWEPMGGHECHRAMFILEPELDKEEYHFIDAQSAKRFILEKLAERAAKPAAQKPDETPATETQPSKP